MSSKDAHYILDIYSAKLNDGGDLDKEFEETDQERLLRDKVKRMAPYDFWVFMRT